MKDISIKEVEPSFLRVLKAFDDNMLMIETLIREKRPDDKVCALAGAAVSALSAECARFEGLLTSEGGKSKLPSYVKMFRDATFKWFMRSRCIKRSFEKPRGYAGDFQVIDWIYENRPEGEGIGFALDRYFLGTPGSEAMRARLELIIDRVCGLVGTDETRAGDEFSIFDLGCGPGRDIFEVLKRVRKVKAVLIDQDPEALRYSEALLSAPAGSIKYVQYNLLRIVAGRKFVAKKFGLHDIVLCVGLYDYLDEASSVKLLASSYNLLKEGGTLIISNWNVSNPSKTELEWVCDWHLYHRTKDDMIGLVRKAGIPGEKAGLEADRTGHFHIVEIRK